MIDHTRYEIDVNIRGFKIKMYVDVPNNFSDETIHEWIKREVFYYIKENTKFTYSQKLI